MLLYRVFNNLVFSSETETNRNRFCLKHSNGQSWLFPIIKPWHTASPGDKNHQKFTVTELHLEKKKHACKESKVAIHMLGKILITSRKYLELSSKQL